MDDLLKQLETQIKTLIERCDELERENVNLQQNALLLTRDKQLLNAKNNAAISQIETMIFRLKSIESAS